MRHLQLFKTTAEFDAAKNDLKKPWVTLTRDDKTSHYSGKNEPKPEPEEDLSDIIRRINGNDEGVPTTYTSVEEIINLING